MDETKQRKKLEPVISGGAEIKEHRSNGSRRKISIRWH